MVSVVTKLSRPFSVSGILASSFHLEDKSHPPGSPQAVSSLWGGLHALYPAPAGARIKAEVSKVWRSAEPDPVCVWGWGGAAVVGGVGKEIAQIHSTRRRLALSILLGCWKPLQGTQTREPQVGRPGGKST